MPVRTAQRRPRTGTQGTLYLHTVLHVRVQDRRRPRAYDDTVRGGGEGSMSPRSGLGIWMRSAALATQARACAVRGVDRDPYRRCASLRGRPLRLVPVSRASPVPCGGPSASPHTPRKTPLSSQRERTLAQSGPTWKPRTVAGAYGAVVPASALGRPRELAEDLAKLVDVAAVRLPVTRLLRLDRLVVEVLGGLHIGRGSAVDSGSSETAPKTARSAAGRSGSIATSSP